MPTKPRAAPGVPNADVRLQQLQGWLRATLGSDFTLAPASSDASLRRYFRVIHDGSSWIAVDAPPQRENLEQFLRVAAMLGAIGLHVPRSRQHDVRAGFALLSDLGTHTYYDELCQGGDPAPLYCDALEALVHMQARGRSHAEQLPLYTEAVLEREVALFTDWFCLQYLQLPLSSGDVESLRALGTWLAQEALAQPQVLVHRDFHSRNLMACEPRTFPANPGILDFQDAVRGPLTYDLVSLLRDCYVAWPDSHVQQWLECFYAGLCVHHPQVAVSSEQLRRWCDVMGVQRHLKAIGIFARLHHRDGRGDYLQHIPRTLDYVRKVAPQYSQLRPLADLIEHRVLPAWAVSADSLTDPY